VFFVLLRRVVVGGGSVCVRERGESAREGGGECERGGESVSVWGWGVGCVAGVF
jgi:hypothetical protein